MPLWYESLSATKIRQYFGFCIHFPVIRFYDRTQIAVIFSYSYYLCPQTAREMNINVKLEKWKIAQKRHRLSDKHVQMARDCGLNPDKLGKIDNHKQEPWKAPLPQFIEEIYFKRFKKTEPAVVKSIREQVADEKTKKEQQKKAKEQKRKEKARYAEKLNPVIEEMKNVFSSVPYGIDHTLKVLENARQIIKAEKLNWQSAVIVELAAVLHDIGAVEAQRKHGSMEGRFQEQESPAIALNMMKKCDYEQSVIDRVCFIIAHHHTPEKIDGMDFQILWEADLIENMQVMEVIKDSGALKPFISDNFKTDSGKDLAFQRYAKNK
jgi:HD-GYP domain-containing protein (c-di-GMP phosphodiesterase class II)